MELCGRFYTSSFFNVCFCVGKSRNSSFVDSPGNGHALVASETVNNLWEALCELPISKNGESSNEHTPLHQACSASDLEAVLHILNSDVTDVNGQDKEGLTPLHIACQSGHMDVVSALLSFGADVNIVDYREGQSPLSVATAAAYASCVKILIENGADVNKGTTRDYLPLHQATSSGHLHIVELLIDAGTDVNAAPHSGWTALHTAAYLGYVDIVDLLLARGADVNQLTADGVPPLHLAVGRGSKGRLDIVRKLVETGHCDLDFRDKSGNTALHKCIYESRKEILQYLINCGSNLNFQSHNGYTPFHRAVDRCCIDSCKLLLEGGCNLELETWIKDGDFPICLARKKGTIAWLKSLTEEPRIPSLVSLQLRCREIIRQSVCKFDVIFRVESLQLPEKMKCYILLS